MAWYDSYSGDPNWYDPSWLSSAGSDTSAWAPNVSYDYGSPDLFSGAQTDWLSGLSADQIDRLSSMSDSDLSSALSQMQAPTASTGINWGNLIDKGLGALTSGSTLATLAGGLLGSQNQSKQTGTSTTTQAPWSPQQPYLLDLFNKAAGASTAGANPYETQALQGMSKVASGPTTNPYAGVDNPYLTASINNASQDAMRNLLPAFQSAERASGSFGNSGVADYFGRAAANTLGNIATNARMQDYQTQQQLGENAVNRTVAGQGNLLTGYQNSSANPWYNLNNYGKSITGSYGGSTSSPIYSNPTAGLLGGALLGSQVYKNLGL